MFRPEVDASRCWARCLVVISAERFNDHYIVDTRDFRHDSAGYSFIEEVKNGHVINRICTTVEDAPKKIVEMMRNYARTGSCLITH